MKKNSIIRPEIRILSEDQKGKGSSLLLTLTFQRNSLTHVTPK